MTRALGLVVNPVAGVGGPAGLKGSDGAEVQAAALRRGAAPRAGERAVAALRAVARSYPDVQVLTVGGAMGEEPVARAGLRLRLVRPAGPGVGSASTRAARPTTAEDTRSAVRALTSAGAGLILFAGGDGTARDVADAAGDGLVLGVPAGVKMYSGCFAVSPAAAGTIAADWLAGRALATEVREVLDVSEQQVRHGRVDPTLYGHVRVPVVAGRTQSRKAATAASRAGAVRQAALGAVEAMRPGRRYLLGPGGTVAEVARLLGVPKTPLGVDVVSGGRLVLADADERSLRQAVAGVDAQAVVTVIGGQGFLLGRGNQQLSAGVLRALGTDPLLVVAAEDKLTDLRGAPLLVDTGDPDLDLALSGHVPVVTGPGSRALYPVHAPEIQGVRQCV